MNGRVLIAGFATRHVAQSAQRAGYRVCAVDHFCDQDLNWYTDDRIRFDELDDLPDAVMEMSARHRFDMLVVTSGAEDIRSSIPICGTSPKKVQKYLDKLEIQHFFEELHIPVPSLAKDNEYPAFLKPCRGAGGWRNAIVHSGAEETVWESLYPGVPYVRQQVACGIPASVCCVTDGKTAKAIATNEQLLRGTAGAEFGFSGSVTPCSHPKAKLMIGYAEKIAAASGCAGTVGIDFLIGEDVVAIELNPRFQATVETVEMATGCNLFAFHTAACNGTLPIRIQAITRHAARKILFADRNMTISTDLRNLAPMVADIPWPGTELEKDQAVVSVFGTGMSRAEALASLDKNITTVRQYLR